MTFPMHGIWQILSNTGEIWPIQMGQRSLSMALPWIQTLQLSDLCSVQSKTKTSAFRTWWVHSALNSVLHCGTSSLVGVRSTHCTVQAGHEKENSPKSPSAAQVMRGLPHFPHPEVLPVLACFCLLRLGLSSILPPWAWALGNPQVCNAFCLLGQSTSIQKYAQVCTSMQYPQLCNASWLQQFLPSFWSRADVATGCSHIYFEYLYTQILSIF